MLHPSFGRAIASALEMKEYVLCPVGLIETLDERQHCWVDYHFRHMNELRLCRLWHSPTMPMAVVEGPARNGVAAIHQSTREFLNRVPAHDQILYTTSKKNALKLVVDGQAQYAICSNHDLPPAVTTLETFSPTMIWVLYKGH